MNKMQNAASRSDPENSTTIMLYGDIGNCGEPDFVTAKDIILQLEAATGDVSVRISSAGGFVTEGIAIANGLRNYSKGRVTVYVDSLAASIASYIAIAGDELVMYADSELMIHQPWDIVQGEALAMRKTADQLDRFRDTLISGYAKKTGLDRARLKSMLEATSYISASEAVELGFADRIEDGEFQTSRSMAAKIQDRASIDRIRLALNKLKSQKEESDMAKATAAPKNEEVIVEVAVIEEEIEAVEVAVEEVLDAVEAGEEVATTDVVAILEAVKRVGETLEFAQELIAQNLNINQARAKIIDRVAKTKGRSVAQTQARAHAQVGVTSVQKSATGMKNALLARAGLSKETDVKNEFRSFTIVDMARESLNQSGVNTRMMNRDEIISQAMRMRNGKTTDFPLLLTGVAAEAAIQGYEQEEDTYSQWTKKVSNRDFNAYAHAGIGNFGALPVMLEDGTYTQITVAEFGEKLKLDTFGGVFRLTRHALVNDQTSVFTDVPYSIAAAARVSIADRVYSVLSSNPILGDAKAAFHADRKNILTGATSVLSAKSLSAARKLMRTMKDGKNNRVQVRPKFLIVPAALEGLAFELLNNQYTPNASNIFEPNPHSGLCEIVVDPRLDDVSESAWYLVGDANKGGGQAVAYLDGVDKPHLDQETEWASDSVEYKVRIDANSGIVNSLPMIYSKGAV